MKKLLFSAVDMNVGGIETSLLTLLNTLIEQEYEITLVLEKKQGTFLKDLDSKIQVIEYKPCESKIFLIRKAINLCKRIYFAMCYKNKFDFAAAYATYSKMASYTARIASNNNVLWGHADYLELFHQDMNQMEEFFEGLQIHQFKHIIFVSKAAAESFSKVFPEEENKVLFCNNLIDAKKINDLANETIQEHKEGYTFINIGRHDELQKKLTRTLEASKQLKQEGYNFQIWLIGEGQDTNLYKQLVNQYGLQEHVKFFGIKKNPYPYMKLADSMLLTSEYEGYPVVFLEAFILNKPIITTDISDARIDIDGKFGKVTKKDITAIYEAMKEFIEKGYCIKETFNPEEYNKNIIKKIENLIHEKG